jgi:hypothetical protein
MGSFLKKVSNGLFGSAQERQEKQRKQNEINQARQQAYHEGNLKGVRAGAKQQGYNDGVKRGKSSPGFIGVMDTTVKTLNRVESSMGFNDMFAGTPAQPNNSKKSQKQRKEDRDPWGVGLP